MAESQDPKQTKGNSQYVDGEDKNAQQFAIQRIYLKDLSYEAPMGVEGFAKEWKPHINQELGSKNIKVDEAHYEVVLSLTITAKLEDKTVFLVEVQQAGLFMIKGFNNQQLGHVLNTVCLQILFPYVRETIDTLLAKGSFPPLMLPPVNFDALFAQAVAQAKEQQSGAESSLN